MIYIYILIDPITYLIRYAGQTSDPDERYKGHLKGNKYRKTHTCNWIQGLLDQGLKPIMVVIDNCEISKLDEVEQGYIRFFKIIGYELTNHSIGGHSSLGCKHSEESRKRRSERQKGRISNLSESGRKGIAEGAKRMLKERPELRIDNLLTKEQRYQAALRGNKIGSERRKLKIKSVNRQTKEEKIFSSIKDAGEFFEINPLRIGNFLRGKNKQTFLKEYNFSYEDKKIDPQEVRV